MGQSHLGSDLPAVDRHQQTGAPFLAMDPLHSLDSWGVHWKDEIAFYSGKRVDLECISFDGAFVVAMTTSKGVPKMTVHCEFPEWVASYMDVGRNFSVVQFVMQQCNDRNTIKGGQGDLLPILHPTFQHCSVAEAYAGLGGWSFGAKWCGVEPALMVEFDHVTAVACSRSHNIDSHDINSATQLASQLSLPDRFVLQADVNDIRTHVIAGFMGIAMWLASPPCQPSSKAGWQRGIEAEDGASFIRFVYLTGLGKSRCMNLENVPGLPDHCDYRLLKQALLEAGWSLVSAHVDQVFPLLPVMRQRWLATCVRNDVLIRPEAKAVAADMCIPEVVPFFGRENSIAKFGCMHKDVPKWFLDACLPSSDAIVAMSDPSLLPKKHRTHNYMKLEGMDVLALRVISSRRPLPNVMANQGSQHLLPFDLLKDKGLHAYLLNDGESLRFVSPFEIGLAMGFPETIQLPVDFMLAWKIVGNSLSIPHACLQCLRSHYLLGDVSVFKGCIKGPMTLCDMILNSRIMMSEFTVSSVDEWMCLISIHHKCDRPLSNTASIGETVIDETESNVGITVQLADEKEVIPVSDDEHPAKRACISPTWQIKEGEPRLVIELQRSDFPNCQGHTIGAAKPSQGGLDFSSMTFPEGCDKHDSNIFVRVLHTQGIWGACQLLPKGLSVLEILQCFLPHARQEHFDNFIVNGWVAMYCSVLVGVESAMIQMRPFGFLRIIQSPLLEHDLPIEVDVTWKFLDLAAFLSAEAAVLISQIAFWTESHQIQFAEFVLAYDVGCFQACLKSAPNSCDHSSSCITGNDFGSQSVHGRGQVFQTLKEIEVPFQPAKCDDNATPAHGNTIRFTTRHPKFGTVRSVTVTKNACVGTMIDILLPGFPCEHQPVLTRDDEPIDPSTLVAEIVKDKLELYFPCDKPWPCVEVVKTVPFAPFVASDHTFAIRDVKGPFDFKAKPIKVVDDLSILHLVASFLELHCSNLTLLVLQGGKTVDPRIQLSALISDMSLEIRVCGLPGGAKNHQDTSKKLADMLAQRGVPDDAKSTRAALVTSKIPQSELAAILSQDEKNAWIALKKKANECKIRLITSQELQAFQKKQRKDKSESKPVQPVSGKRKHPRNNQSLDPNRVFIDPCHFSCNGTQPVTIKVAQWGPDAKGIAIANCVEAAKLLPVSRLSADGLALLVLTEKAFNGIEPFTMPATDEQANPILASGVLLNFGDSRIEYKPALPGATLGEVPTATLEVTIQRSLVPKWQDVHNPLNYLGLQLPEIRNDQVIQSWSFKPYTKERVKCKHDEAAYVHGFVKIPESSLASTLQRSGLAGVFLQVKGPDRKHCPRFGVIAMHGHSLDDVVKQAKAIDDVLGVVQLGQPNVYGLRARREHLASIRKQALPQGIAIQEGEIPPDANWWILKNVKASTTCSALTAALRTLGWEASAIRPGGKFARVLTLLPLTCASTMTMRRWSL